LPETRRSPPKTGARLGFAAFFPQQGGNLVACLRPAGMKGEIDEKRLVLRVALLIGRPAADLISSPPSVRIVTFSTEPLLDPSGAWSPKATEQ
jgi:hypothetical protein